MAKFRCQRQLRTVGRSVYVPWPKQALLDLRLFVGDWIEFELDTDTHEVTIRAVYRRDVAPMPGPRVNARDMLPAAPADPPMPPHPDDKQRQLVEVGS
jgi:hypothetical protein